MPDTVEAPDVFRQTYPRGMLIFFYGVIWIVGALAGYIVLDPYLAANNSVAMAFVPV